MIRFRRRGYSLDELCVKFNVRKATVQGWANSIPLSDKAKARIRFRILEGGRKGRLTANRVNRQKIKWWKQQVWERSSLVVHEATLTSGIRRLFCALLYLCEGSRYPSSRVLGFGNSNPRIIRFFLYLLRSCFQVDKRKFRCQISHRWDQDFDSLVSYWSRITGIPSRQFYRTKPDKRTKGKKTLWKDYRGVCFVQYFDTTLQLTLQCMGEALMKNSGAGESRTLASSMPWRCAPATPQPQSNIRV